VELITGTELDRIETTGALKKVHLKNGTDVTCTALAAGIGIVPNVAFLAGSGIDVRTGVITDACLRTNVADVWAAGDAAESFDVHVGGHRIIGNWQNAMFQGKAAGINMTTPPGEEQQPFTAVTTYTINVFDVPVTFMGATDIAVDERIVRQTPKGASLQLFVKGGRAVGATCVGPFAERAKVQALLQTESMPADVDAALFS
jgi:NADPH-dependent 2,4-dienoyl-CoA reductase/sulfur reductase-like enzyme